MKVSFSVGRSGDAKVVFFLAGSFSEIAKPSKLMGWFDKSSSSLIYRSCWGNQMFSKSVLMLEVVRRTKLMSNFFDV
jgi:hypothetical protein